jgi:hypothetical protein
LSRLHILKPDDIPGGPSTPGARSRKSIFFGIFSRRERWSLSRRGVLVLGSLLVILAIGIGRFTYPFLAVTHPVSANILIVEGWVPPWSMIELSEECRKQQYQRFLVVASVSDARSEYDLGWLTGEHCAAALVKNGVPEDRLSKLFSVAVRKDRTFHTFLQAKEWLATNNLPVTGINVATLGPHARRSGFLCRKVFGPGMPVGTFALSPREYDTRRWWSYSEGVRDVTGEIIAYLYARLFFTPP